MSRVLAQATVEKLEDGPMPVWEVDVTGGFEDGMGKAHRFYTISAKTDDNAAQEGIRRFVEEMENLLP